jgi:hypothetical protein
VRNFLKIADSADVLPLLLALQRQPALWDRDTLRTTHPESPHTEVADIWLRFNELPAEGNEAAILDEHESVWYPAIDALPQARPLIFGLMARVEGERLGRCLITRLAPGRSIAPHEDGGSHAAYYERFHIALQSTPGTLFRCGGETVHMPPGSVWWFNNSVEHEVVNNGSDDRIHLIVDIRCGSLAC